MIFHRSSLLLLTAALTVCGCNFSGTQQKTRYVEPVLPASMSCRDLVDHLNRQAHGLHAWRSTDAVLTARMPNGLPLRLSANIACAAPSQFRLKASNLVADVDLGANQERCWFYTKPGEGKVLTWKHEDAELLQNLSLGVPRIDPDWLMVVLGVMPLESEMFDISSGPAGSRELWLTAVSDDYDGRPLRRVIKVDQVSGRVREHVIYNHERSALVRASLNGHRTVQGYLVPQAVRLEFPQMDTEMTIKLGRIEPNCALADALWRVPNHRNVDVVDLGSAVRMQLNQAPQQSATSVSPATHATAELTPGIRTATATASLPDGRPMNHQPARDTPDFGQTFLRGVSHDPWTRTDESLNEKSVSTETLSEKSMARDETNVFTEPAVAEPDTTETPEWDLPAEPVRNAHSNGHGRGWSMNWWR